MDKFDNEAFVKQIAVNKNDPTDDLADNAAMLAYYGYQQALWEGRVALLKLEVRTREALVSEELRESGVKTTVESMKAKVAVDDEVVRLSKSLVIAQSQDAAYTNALRAFADRGNNVRSIGTWLRQERNNTVNSAPVERERGEPLDAESRRELAKRLANNR